MDLSGEEMTARSLRAVAAPLSCLLAAGLWCLRASGESVSNAPDVAADASSSSSASTTTSASASVSPAESAVKQVETYLIPDAPALTLIGSTTTIDRPGSPSKVGAALVNLITPQGTVRNGVALEISLRAFGYEKSWKEYRYDGLTRFLSRLAVSIGTATDSATATTPTATRLAMGLRLVFLDGSDPLLDPRYIAKSKLLDSCLSVPGGIGEYNKCLTQVEDGWKKPDAPWNAEGLALAIAGSGAFTESKLSTGVWDAAAAWLTSGLPFGEWGQLSFAVQASRSFVAKKNIGAGAARMRVGTDSFRYVLEGAYASSKPDDPLDRHGRLLTGVELRIASGTWLTASLGGDFSGKDTPVSALALSSLKYAFVDRPSF